MHFLKILVFSLFYLAGNSFATPNAPMTFRTFDPCRGNSSLCGTRILASGLIENDSHKKLASFISNAAKNELPPRLTIVFDSPGGSIAGGMELGHLIRKNGYDTAIEMDIEEEIPANGKSGIRTIASNTMCASACSLAFLGGINRSITPDGRYGVHQFYSKDGSLNASNTQVAMVIISRYIEKMGVDRRLLDLASFADPKSIRWLEDSVVRELGIDNTRPILAKWVINADSNGMPSVAIHQPIALNRELILSIHYGKNGYIVTAVALFGKKVPFTDHNNRFPEGKDLEIQFQSNQKTIAKTIPLSPWKKIRSYPDGSVAYAGNSIITRNDLLKISAAKNLTFDDYFPNFIRDLSMKTEISTEGLNNGVSLLVRTN